MRQTIAFSEVVATTKPKNRVNERGIRALESVGLVLAVLCAGYSAVHLPLIFAVLALTAIMFFIWAWSPVYAVGLAFLSSMLLPRSLPSLQAGGTTFGVGIGDLLIFMVSIPVFVKGARANRVFFRDKLSRAVLWFAGAYAVSAIVSVALDPATLVWAVGSLAKVYEYFLLFWMLRVLIRDGESMESVWRIFNICGFGVIAFAVLQFFSPAAYEALMLSLGNRSSVAQGILYADVGWRLQGPFGNANGLAYFMLIAATFGMAQAMMRSTFRERVVPLLLACCSLLVVIYTQSREVYLGATVAFAIIFLRAPTARRTRWMAFLIAGIAAIVIVVGWTVIYKRVVGYSFGYTNGSVSYLVQTPSVNARVAQWIAALKALENYGIFGAGLGRYGIAVGEYIQAGSSAVGGIHNTYLRAILEGGIALFLTLLMLIKSMFDLFRVLDARLGGTLLGMLAALLVIGFAGDTFQDSALVAPLMFLLPSLIRLAQSSIAHDLWQKNHPAISGGNAAGIVGYSRL